MATSKNYTAELMKRAGELPAKIVALEKTIQAVDTRMAELKGVGLTYATEHWRKDAGGEPKFLYLLYPTRAGEKRRRDYVGSDPAKVAEARAGIARAREYDQLAEQQRTLTGRIYRVGDDLDRALLNLSGRDW